jgi:hypothetical protein
MGSLGLTCDQVKINFAVGSWATGSGLPEYLYWVSHQHCPSTYTGFNHCYLLRYFCARTFQGLHSVRLWTPTIFSSWTDKNAIFQCKILFKGKNFSLI